MRSRVLVCIIRRRLVLLLLLGWGRGRLRLRLEGRLRTLLLDRAGMDSTRVLLAMDMRMGDLLVRSLFTRFSFFY